MVASDPKFEPGNVLADKYQVESVLGEGGMGVVVAARHLHLNQRVAIKFLLGEHLAAAGGAERFLREARAAAQIKSEHVTRVMDVAMLDTGEPYIVMEYLDGGDLGRLLEESGILTTSRAVQYVLQACEALAEAHALGIVHRDLKPANLFLTHRADGSVLIKVLDFGVSKVLGPADPGDVSLTSPRSLMGSPQYASPEQIRSAKTVDARTDIWALGIILYELLAGQPPFDGESVSAVLAQVAADPPRPLKDHGCDVPDELEAVIMRCLQKNPEGRFSNIAGLAHALLPFAPASSQISVDRVSRVMTSGGSVAAMPTDRPPPPTSPNAATVAAWGGGDGRSHRSMLVAGATVVGVLAAATGFFVLRGTPETDQPAAPATPASTATTEAKDDFPLPSPSASAASTAVTRAPPSEPVPGAMIDAGATAAPVAKPAPVKRTLQAPASRPRVTRPTRTVAPPRPKSAPKTVDPLDGRH